MFKVNNFVANICKCFQTPSLYSHLNNCFVRKFEKWVSVVEYFANTSKKLVFPLQCAVYFAQNKIAKRFLPLPRAVKMEKWQLRKCARVPTVTLCTGGASTFCALRSCTRTSPNVPKRNVCADVMGSFNRSVRKEKRDLEEIPSHFPQLDWHRHDERALTSLYVV